MPKIMKTKKQAIKEACKQLREEIGIKRLDYLTLDTISTRCTCGETGAIKAVYNGKVLFKTKIVGYCSGCYTDYEF